MKKSRMIIALSTLTLIAVLVGAWQACVLFTRPVSMQIDKPEDLPVIDVTLNPVQGPPVKGWWLEGSDKNSPAVMLLHGFRRNRTEMLNRARALHARGYGVLLFDFQAHGESDGERITFGWIESEDVDAAYAWLRQNHPHRKLGAIAIGSGGSAFLLSHVSGKFNAVVLERVTPDLDDAIVNLLSIKFGKTAAAMIAPFVELQTQMSLGFKVKDLRPIDHLASIKAPIMILGGEFDHRVSAQSSELMFERANAPKELWIVPEATHDDLYLQSRKEYEERVFKFLDKNLNK